MHNNSDRDAECAGSHALDPHHEAVHGASVREDVAGYEEALRQFMMSGRCEAVAIMKGGGVSERERRELEGSGLYQGDAAVPVDLQAQRRELEEAGWKPIERMGKIVWQRPDSQYLYPQGVAIRMVREDAENESKEEY